jgi:hypothetical protein
MSENKLFIIHITLWNLGLIALSAFCCWYFHTLWGIIPLFFYTSSSISRKEGSSDND